MLSSLMEKKMKKLRGEVLIAVMDDGEAFLGKLRDFDEDTLILNEVYEGPSSEIKWETLGEEDDQSPEMGYGFVDWVRVNLEEVYLRVNHVSRIWPWEHIEGYEKEPNTKKRRATYTRTPAIDILSED
ncbi:MAG: hypothetical protein ACOCTN_04045 [Candidatus Natronoplasma sp.]